MIFRTFLICSCDFNVCTDRARICFNPLSVNPTKWSNTRKQFVGNLATNCLIVFDHFMNLAIKGLIYQVKGKNRKCSFEYALEEKSGSSSRNKKMA